MKRFIYSKNKTEQNKTKQKTNKQTVMLPILAKKYTFANSMCS